MDRNDAPEILDDIAEAARQVAAGFYKFLGPLPESKGDLTALIGKCFEISSSLHNLAEAIKGAQRLSIYTTISEDVHDVAYSLDYTFKDVYQIMGESLNEAKKAKLSQSTGYRKTWRNINDYFLRESRNTLTRRLEFCRQVLVGLTDILHDRSPRDPELFNDLAARVSHLLDVQEARPQRAIEWPDSSDTPSSSGPAKRSPSFERTRPIVARANQGRQIKLTSRPKPPGRRPSPEPGWRRNRLPPAPDVPHSDASTDFSNDSIASSASQRIRMSQWVQRVFERSPPSTPLSETGQPSCCLGDDNPNARDWLAEDYIQLLDAPFENGDLRVYFYVRARDCRARFLCEKTRPIRQQEACTIYLTDLDVERRGQFLDFRRVNANGRNLGLWCCLRFRSYETLVLFFCTFLALRSQDNGRPLGDIEDWVLAREQVLFSGNINDDRFAHRLRLLRDKDSGGIRLQATNIRGEMKDMPVWTAFITHQVHSKKWMRQSGKKTVLLADLYRYVFVDDYTPPIASGGQHDLTFANEEDADDFMDEIDELFSASSD